jgi:hypothetical protein
MFRRWYALCLLFLVLPLLGTACLELEQTLELAADGSGKLHVSIRLDRAAVERMKEKSGYRPSEEEQAAEKEMFDVARIRKNFEAVEGVKLLDIQPLDDEKSMGMKASLQFDSQAKLAQGMRALITRAPGQRGGQLSWVFVKAGDGRLRLIVYPSGRDDYQQAKEQLQRFGTLGEEERAMQAVFFDQMKASLGGMRIAWRIKVPGAIDKVETLKRVADDVAEMQVSSADIKTMEDMTRLGGMRFVIEFKGEIANVRVLDAEPGEDQPAKTEKTEEAGK